MTPDPDAAAVEAAVLGRNRDLACNLLFGLVSAAAAGDPQARADLLGDAGVHGLMEAVDIDPGAAATALVRQWLGPLAWIVEDRTGR